MSELPLELRNEQGTRLTSALLVLANMLPIAGVLFAGWDVGTIVLLFWAENLVIGSLQLIKLLSHPNRGGLPMALFFTVHYGGFTAAHGLFIFSLFSLRESLLGDSAGSPHTDLPASLLSLLSHALSNLPSLWLLGLLALILSHAGSLLLHYFLQGERLRTPLAELMSAPYRRVVVLHVAIILGGVGIEALGSPLPLLVLLVLLKVVLDLRAHRRSHRHAAAAPAA